MRQIAEATRKECNQVVMSRSPFPFLASKSFGRRREKIFFAALISHSHKENYDPEKLYLAYVFCSLSQIRSVHPLSLFFLTDPPIVPPFFLLDYFIHSFNSLSTLFLPRSLILIFIHSFRTYCFLGKMRISHLR